MRLSGRFALGLRWPRCVCHLNLGLSTWDLGGWQQNLRHSFCPLAAEVLQSLMCILTAGGDWVTAFSRDALWSSEMIQSPIADRTTDSTPKHTRINKPCSSSYGPSCVTIDKLKHLYPQAGTLCARTLKNSLLESTHYHSRGLRVIWLTRSRLVDVITTPLWTKTRLSDSWVLIIATAACLS